MPPTRNRLARAANVIHAFTGYEGAAPYGISVYVLKIVVEMVVVVSGGSTVLTNSVNVTDEKDGEKNSSVRVVVSLVSTAVTCQVCTDGDVLIDVIVSGVELVWTTAFSVAVEKTVWIVDTEVKDVERIDRVVDVVVRVSVDVEKNSTVRVRVRVSVWLSVRVISVVPVSEHDRVVMKMLVEMPDVIVDVI